MPTVHVQDPTANRGNSFTGEIDMNRGKVMFEVILMFAFVVLVAMYGIWKYSTAETNSFNKFVDKANELTGEVSHLKQVLESCRGEFKVVDDKSESNRVFANDLSERLARLQNDVADLKLKTIPQSFDLRIHIEEPIAVQVAKPPPVPKPPRKVISKIKKQLNGLSK